MAEMFRRTPMLEGHTEQGQLMLISDRCGSICPENWPNVVNYDLYTKIQLPRGKNQQPRESIRRFVHDELAFDLLDKLLVIDPAQRLDADTALNHDFLWSEPMEHDLGPMLAQHEKSRPHFRHEQVKQQQIEESNPWRGLPR